MKNFQLLLVACLLLAAPSSCAIAQQADADVRINQIQIVGTHNSYHAGLSPGIAKLLREKDPKVYESLNYTHPSLTTQLNEGVRQMEIDIFADTKGGLYAHPYMEKMVAQAGLPPDRPTTPTA